ncbi:MAG: hypothetical protein QM727_09575 [Niabella sp.]
MKTIFYIMIAGCFLLTSCNNNDDMTTIVNGDGSCERIFSSKVSDEFIKGDTSDHPFPVNLKGWTINWKAKDGELRTHWPFKNWQGEKGDSLFRVTAIISKRFAFVRELSDSFRFKHDYPWADIRISPALEKKFRWFYSYYTYREVFSGLPVKPPVPINRYLTKEEAGYWFTGQPDITRGMNGVEAKDLLDDIEAKANKWFMHNLFEFQYATLLGNLSLFPGSPDRKLMLEKKDSVFARSYDDFVNADIRIGIALNKYFQTKAFNPLLDNKDERMKRIIEPEGVERFSRYFEAHINYKLIMPGELLRSNGVLTGDTLSWKVDAYRLLNGDYTIEASSKKTNIWAWILSVFIILAASVFLFKGNRKKI